jgi:hypothetical protein
VIVYFISVNLLVVILLVSVCQPEDTMGQKPSIPTDLSKEVRVIGAGFSRTGTVSFALALERLLDGPVCHSGTNILLREEGALHVPHSRIAFPPI